MTNLSTAIYIGDLLDHLRFAAIAWTFFLAPSIFVFILIVEFGEQRRPAFERMPDWRYWGLTVAAIGFAVSSSILILTPSQDAYYAMVAGNQTATPAVKQWMEKQL